VRKDFITSAGHLRSGESRRRESIAIANLSRNRRFAKKAIIRSFLSLPAGLRQWVVLYCLMKWVGFLLNCGDVHIHEPFPSG
jgi:hypothetical protein